MLHEGRTLLVGIRPIAETTRFYSNALFSKRIYTSSCNINNSWRISLTWEPSHSLARKDISCLSEGETSLLWKWNLWFGPYRLTSFDSSMKISFVFLLFISVYSEVSWRSLGLISYLFRKMTPKLHLTVTIFIPYFQAELLWPCEVWIKCSKSVKNFCQCSCTRETLYSRYLEKIICFLFSTHSLK